MSDDGVVHLKAIKKLDDESDLSSVPSNGDTIHYENGAVKKKQKQKIPKKLMRYRVS